MPVELKVPAVGESITEVQIGQWLKSAGQTVEKDENLVEIESDKATVELPSPIKGVLTQVLKQKGQTAAVGEVIGYMDETGAAKSDGNPKEATAKEPPAKETTKQPAQASGKSAAPADSVKTSTPSAQASTVRVMPAAQRAMAENDLSAEDLKATGPGGRMLKEDVERQAAQKGSGAAQPSAPAPAAASTKASAPVPVPRENKPPLLKPSEARGAPGRKEEAVAMSPIRRRIAERLLEAQQTAAMLTTFNEVEMTNVMALRTKFKDAFQQRYGVKLGFMSFFVKATIEALRQVPQINAKIQGNDVVYHHYYDIGIAVSTPKGLVVPVLRNAENMTFGEIELAIEEFGRRARENKIKLDELEGGTFTISNGGVFGSLLSTPIINPPQSGILGLHMIEERPVARDGQVVIRPMMYVAVTYDHRIVDGREAVTFLRRIKEVMEDPSRMLLEV